MPLPPRARVLTGAMASSLALGLLPLLPAAAGAPATAAEPPAARGVAALPLARLAAETGRAAALSAGGTSAAAWAAIVANGRSEVRRGLPAATRGAPAGGGGRRGSASGAVVGAVVGRSSAGSAPTPAPSSGPAPAPTPTPTPTPTQPLPTRAPVVFGVAAATVAQLGQQETELGHRVGGVRVYKLWGDTLFDGATTAMGQDHALFLSVRSKRRDGSIVSYADLADAKPGSRVYTEAQQMARQVRAYGRTVYLVYQHEPDAQEAATFGDGPTFVRAWRAWVSILRAEGATNAVNVWTTTGWGFTRTDDRASVNFWPGTGYVDVVGADVYNFYTCGNPNGRWRSFADQSADVMSFAADHGNLPVAFLEWSSEEDSQQPGRKAQWVDDARATLTSPAYARVVAALQWSGRNSPSFPCAFDLASSTSATQAFGALAADPRFAGLSIPH